MFCAAPAVMTPEELNRGKQCIFAGAGRQIIVLHDMKNFYCRRSRHVRHGKCPHPRVEANVDTCLFCFAQKHLPYFVTAGSA